MGGPQTQANNQQRDDTAGVARLAGTNLEAVQEFVEMYEHFQSLASKRELTKEESQLLNDVLRKYRNCCGQYALTAVLREQGHNITLPQVIDKTNPLGMFTGPKEIVGFLKKYNIPSTAKNRGTQEGLFKHLQTGETAILLVNAGGSPHWIAVGSAIQTPDQTLWTVTDAADMTGNGTFIGTMTSEELEAVWSKPFGKASGLLPYKKYWVAVGQANPRLIMRSPLSTVVPDNMAALTEGLAENSARTLNITRDAIQRVLPGRRENSPQEDWRPLRMPRR